MKIFLCILICMIGCFTAFAQDIHFTAAETPKENPWSGVLAMTQDPQGYLWLGTKEGVYKYDGHQYTLYQHEPSNPNSLALNWVECEGTGLGLSLSYDIVVKGHGGSIQVNSVDGEGSEFTITLPIS